MGSETYLGISRIVITAPLTWYKNKHDYGLFTLRFLDRLICNKKINIPGSRGSSKSHRPGQR